MLDTRISAIYGQGMEFVALAKLAGAVAVPVVAVAALFYQMMAHAMKPFRDDIAELRKEVHQIDVRLAGVEEAVRRPAWFKDNA